MKYLSALKPYRKAIVAGAFSAVAVAATLYDFPSLQVLAAFCTPIAVYFVPNKAA
jgi:hypothetical protein